MNETLRRIYEIGIVPVVAIDDAARAVPLARALLAGGLPAMEITFRTAAGEEAMRAVIREVPEMLVGAGTVTTRDQADRAADAGARFIVSPGFDPELVKYVIAKNLPVIPGTATPGEMEQAMALGLDAVKFFPAEQSGGIAMLKAIAGPFRTLKWMPTGGINTKNLAEYMKFDQILACGGTWMVKSDLINNEKWDEITAICKEAVWNMLGFTLRHIGINCPDDKEAAAAAGLFAALFGFEYRPGSSSSFAGTYVECMNGNGRGTHGHIAVGTSNVDRAISYLGRKGVTFSEETRKTDARGNTTLIYLNEEIAGFAVHLVKN